MLSTLDQPRLNLAWSRYVLRFFKLRIGKIFLCKKVAGLGGGHLNGQDGGWFSSYFLHTFKKSHSRLIQFLSVSRKCFEFFTSFHFWLILSIAIGTWNWSQMSFWVVQSCKINIFSLNETEKMNPFLNYFVCFVILEMFSIGAY